MRTNNKVGGSLELKLTNLHKLVTVFVLGVAMSMILAACGGGGTTSSTGGTVSAITGSLIDGYITGGTVCLDTNSNGKCDAGEPTATTAASGVFSISIPSGTTTTGKKIVAYISTSATDTDGPITAAYTLLAPAPGSSGSTVVTPLTTLVALNPASGVAGVAAALGLPESTITGDYIANSSTGAHNIAKYLAAVIATVQNAQSSVAPDSTGILTAVEAVTTPSDIVAAAAATTPAAITTLVNTVTAVPGAPTIGTATAGSASATVTFTAPSSGGAILGYTVTSNPAGGVDSNAGTKSLSHTVTGLTVGTSYTFTVKATSAGGNSVASGASNSVVPTAPTSPTTAATSPAHTIIQSVFTTTAADVAGTNLCPNWGQATQCTTLTVGGVETEKYSALTYEGIQLYDALNTATTPVITNLNVSTAANVHFDVWTPNVTSLGLSLIAFTSPATTSTSSFQVNSTLTTGTWNSIDIPLSSFTGVDLTSINQLMFVGVTPASGGTIYVQNIYFWGTSSVAATAPGVPTIGTATGGNASATVSFTAPSSNGGSVITGYTVTASPAAGTDSNAGTTALTHTITGLTNGTSYTFTVKATNSVGTSAASTASNTVTPAAPSGGGTVSTASSWALGGTADFNGATSSLVSNQPTGGLQSNAAKVVVAASSQYFGTTFLTIPNAEFCTTAQPTVSVEVYAPTAGKVIELKLEQDGDVTKNIEMRKMSIAGWNTYTFNCLTDSGLTSLVQPTASYVEGTVYNKASMLFNFLSVSPGETWYWDQVTYTPTAATTYVPPPVFAAPTVAASVPAHSVLFSVLTTTAADLAGTNLCPGWGQATQCTLLNIGGVETEEYASLNFEGIALLGNTDVSTATHVHFDAWTNVTSLGLNLISPGPVQTQINSTLTTGVWNSVDIPLTSFSPVVLTSVFQLMFVGVSPTSGGTVYIQNLYFW